MMYMKKPVAIEAIQWTGDNIDDMYDFIQTDFSHDDEHLYIKTLEGVMTADRYDFIIRGVKNEFYPCKPDIFEETYEPI